MPWPTPAPATGRCGERPGIPSSAPRHPATRAGRRGRQRARTRGRRDAPPAPPPSNGSRRARCPRCPRSAEPAATTGTCRRTSSSTTSSSTVRPNRTMPSTRSARSRTCFADAGPPMRGEDEDALALSRGRLLVAEDHGRVVRARQVGEDDAGRVVVPVRQRPAEPARAVVERRHGAVNAVARRGRHQVGVAVHARDRGNRDAGAPRDLVDRRRAPPGTARSDVSAFTTRRIAAGSVPPRPVAESVGQGQQREGGDPVLAGVLAAEQMWEGGVEVGFPAAAASLARGPSPSRAATRSPQTRRARVQPVEVDGLRIGPIGDDRGLEQAAGPRHGREEPGSNQARRRGPRSAVIRPASTSAADRKSSPPGSRWAGIGLVGAEPGRARPSAHGRSARRRPREHDRSQGPGRTRCWHGCRPGSGTWPGQISQPEVADRIDRRRRARSASSGVSIGP